MKRRALLAALVPLTAGCFSGTRAQTDDPTPTATSTPDETPPDETPTPDETGDRTEAIRRIDTAQDRLREAVYIYTGGVSSDLTDVSAAASEFDDRSVLLKLSDAQTAINEARRVAVTPDQTETVDSLRKMQQFLTQATDLQAWLIEGHEAVADTYDALDDDEIVEDELDEVKRAVENATPPLETIASIDPSSAESTEVIGVDEYERKQAQFEDEMDVLGQLHSSLSTIQSGRNELDAARAEADNGDYYSAERAADRVAETLDETVEQLEDLSNDLPSGADAFEDQVKDVLGLARDYASEADDLHDRYD